MAAVLTPEKTAETQALVARVREGSLALKFGETGLQLRNLEEALSFCKSMELSGFAPNGVKAASILWMIQRGAELRLGPTASMDAFYIGPSKKPELYAKSALGVCLSQGALDENYKIWTDGEGAAMVSYFTFKRKGWSEPRTVRFAFAEAKTAQLVKEGSNWQKWPQRMCQARVVAFALKDYFQDVLMGVPLEGDREAIDAEATEITEISRETLPAAPDPLFAQLAQAEPELPANSTWDDMFDAPKVEPEENIPVDPQAAMDAMHVKEQYEAHNAAMANKLEAELEKLHAPTPLIDMPPAEPPPMRRGMASKKDCDWFYGLCRTKGLNDFQIKERLGVAGYESIDQVPADVLAEMTKKVESAKVKK